MDQDWAADELTAMDEPAVPRQRKPGAGGNAVAPHPRLPGAGAAQQCAASADWAALQALIFTANGLAG